MIPEKLEQTSAADFRRPKEKKRSSCSLDFERNRHHPSPNLKKKKKNLMKRKNYKIFKYEKFNPPNSLCQAVILKTNEFLPKKKTFHTGSGFSERKFSNATFRAK